jgi:hypothetical protein
MRMHLAKTTIYTAELLYMMEQYRRAPQKAIKMMTHIRLFNMLMMLLITRCA